VYHLSGTRMLHNLDDQAVFGTDLFNSGDTTETVDKFKISTIAVSMSIYAFALPLICLADKLDYPPQPIPSG
jgi:hypothetical protein